MPVKDEPVALYNKQFGSGPSLVILHGLFGSWENWRSHARQLAEHFQVTLLDLRNHGQSEHRSVMNYPVMASDDSLSLISAPDNTRHTTRKYLREWG